MNSSFLCKGPNLEGLTSFCIDPLETKVHDDAIMYIPARRRDPERLYVLITNAARFLSSETFKQKYVPGINTRSETIYAPGGSSFMLPKEIIETG